MSRIFRSICLASVQTGLLVRVARRVSSYGWLGKAISTALDNLMLTLYGIELTSRSLGVKELVVGHSTGVVLGGNGIRCTGRLHVSSGVVFARRYTPASAAEPALFFDIDGGLTIGAYAAILGPVQIKGSVTIGALMLLTSGILEPGDYVGALARMVAPETGR